MKAATLLCFFTFLFASIACRYPAKQFSLCLGHLPCKVECKTDLRGNAIEVSAGFGPSLTYFSLGPHINSKEAYCGTPKTEPQVTCHAVTDFFSPDHVVSWLWTLRDLPITNSVGGQQDIIKKCCKVNMLRRYKVDWITGDHEELDPPVTAQFECSGDYFVPEHYAFCRSIFPGQHTSKCELLDRCGVVKASVLSCGKCVWRVDVNLVFSEVPLAGDDVQVDLELSLDSATSFDDLYKDVPSDVDTQYRPIGLPENLPMSSPGIVQSPRMTYL
ncbi:uncharacterized protein L969DRAFT_95233 [Mixia osmundae IAM 14324]|uniref:Chitin-binding type-4 domain-containing protein n=1 Tax=Mixia osmundae (strain CBS 9802 / IAM 14324 / JCM 22182 / KY 12970) TaxID=764103 RepID=G7E6S1_MIXOS|nr:uncharacterized protein L969DRAFT_95233 [Mixia osmundae IAM 14324]KEI39086.1 hypothetical protein L969DRAFT_95233 [Mixia osmundae IAM 14324]GAA98531.1 hypothetical protein E5Q_05218 [Mixia osmundae IAM 14324]